MKPNHPALSIKIHWSDEDNAYVAHCDEHPYQYLSAFGDTPEEALQMYFVVLVNSLDPEDEADLNSPPLLIREADNDEAELLATDWVS